MALYRFHVLGEADALRPQIQVYLQSAIKDPVLPREDGSTHPGRITSSPGYQLNNIEMCSYSQLILAFCFGLSLLSSSKATPVDARTIAQHVHSAAAANAYTDIVRRLPVIPSLERRSTYRTEGKIDLEQSWEDVTLFAM